MGFKDEAFETRTLGNLFRSPEYLAKITVAIMKGVIYMRKIYIRTSDIFDYKDTEKRMKHFDFCRKKALECGLICRSHIDGMNTRLFIEGRKSKMVRYYLATIFKTGDGANGVKRLISIIFTH